MSTYDEPVLRMDQNFLARLTWLAEVHDACYRDKWIEAASNLASGRDEPKSFKSPKAARDYIEAYFYWLLNEERYLEAGALTWHRGMFNPAPLHVQRVFACVTDYDQVILIGAGDLGKTNNSSAWFALDLIRDPGDTTIKLASVNEKNLRGNLYARVANYLRNAMFCPALEYDDRHMKIWQEGCRPDAGVEGILLGRDTTARGSLKGYHPQQFRQVEHVKWGFLTRIRILLDEAQQFSNGVLEDLGSPMTSIKSDGKHLMKILCTANPVSEDKWVIAEAAPLRGWNEDQIDYLYDWSSPKGWRVCRLDTVRTENIVHRREIYPGFPTVDTESRFLNGTIITARWYVFWRGWPPPGKANDVVIPTSWFDQSIGEPVYTGPVTNFAGFDPAYEHDSAVLAVGRYGQASGWLDGEGRSHEFESRMLASGQKERRHCMVLDQLIYLEAKDPAAMGVEIRRWCELLRIDPKNVAGDATGSGIGTTSHLRTYWGDILALNWTSGSTMVKILAEDKEDARYQSANVISEMYYTLRRWMEPRVKAVFINPECDHRDKLKHQLTNRQFTYELGSKGFEVESKKKFRSRGNESPGESDATIQITFVIRQRGFALPALSDEQAAIKNLTPEGEIRLDQTSDLHTTLRSGWVEPQLGFTPVVVPERLQLGR